MHIDIHHHYDAAPDRVHAMLTDPAFWQFALDGQVDSCQVDAVADGVTIQLGMAAPSQVSRFTGDTIQATLKATWASQGSDTWQGPITIDPGKLPGDFTGSSTIAPAGDGTDVTYDGNFTIKIPLLGKTIEEKALPYMTGVLDAQQVKGAEWLVSH